MNIGNTLFFINAIILGYCIYTNKDKKNTYNKKYGTARG